MKPVMNEPDNRLIHLKQHISLAANELARSSNTNDGLGSLIYLGNHHDSVPRELIADPHLESGEIHTWMLMKIQVSNPAIPTSIPSQEKLMGYLKCSRPVLSRHLQVLRALRWITLCEEVRGSNGQYKGYVYAQHDKPLNLADTLFLDPNYIEFLESQNKVDSLKRLRIVKSSVLMHMDYQVVTNPAFEAPSALETASQHLKPGKGKKINQLDTYRACPDSVLKDDNTDHVNNIYMAENKNSDHVNNIYMDKSPAQSDSHHVNNIYMAAIEQKPDHVNVYMDGVVCSSSNLYIKTTTTKQQQIEKLRFPKILEESPRLKLYAAKLLDPLSQNDQQFVLDYLSDRLKAAKQGACKPVNDLIGYLRWIITNKQNNTLPPSSFGIRDSLSDTPAKPAEWEVQKESPEEIERNHKQSMRKLEELKKAIRV